MERALQLVRESSALEESIKVARSYVAEAQALLDPIADRPPVTALRGAASNLLDGIATIRFA